MALSTENTLLIVGGALLLPSVLSSLAPTKSAGVTVAISYDAAHQAALRSLPTTFGVSAAAVPDFIGWVSKVRAALVAKRGTFREGATDYPAALAIELAVMIAALRAARDRLEGLGPWGWFNDESDNLALLEASLRGMSGYDVAPAQYVPDSLRAIAAVAAELDAAHVLFNGTPPGEVSALDSVGTAIVRLPDTITSAAEKAGEFVAELAATTAGALAFSTPVIVAGLAYVWWKYA